MGDNEEYAVAETSFGPIFSRIYSFFASHSRSSMKTYDHIARDISESKHRRILDVGCGPGLLLSAIIRHSPESVAYGTDPSPSMVAIARKRLKEHIEEGKADILSGNSMNIPFQGKFDLIISSMSFHHWEDREKSLEYLSSLLEQHGSIIIYEHFREGGAGESPQKVYHSLSGKEAGKFNIKGFQRRIRVDGDLISLTFSR